MIMNVHGTRRAMQSVHFLYLQYEAADETVNTNTVSIYFFRSTSRCYRQMFTQLEVPACNESEKVQTSCEDSGLHERMARTV